MHHRHPAPEPEYARHAVLYHTAFTSDFWAVLAVLFRAVHEFNPNTNPNLVPIRTCSLLAPTGRRLSVLYFVAFFVVIAGLVVYHIAGATDAYQQGDEADPLLSHMKGSETALAALLAAVAAVWLAARRAPGKPSPAPPRPGNCGPRPPFWPRHWPVRPWSTWSGASTVVNRPGTVHE